MNQALGLRGKAALVTGSSRGWGRAVAFQLAREGVAVAINGTKRESVDAVVEEIRAAGGRTAGVAADVATVGGAQAAVKAAVDAFGRLDILVHSTGRKRPALLLDMTPDDWDCVIAVQLRSVFLCTKFAAAQMAAQGRGGRIVLMAGGSTQGLYGLANHAASKGAVLAAMLSWAAELKEHGISVNAARGAVSTEGTAALRSSLWARLGEHLNDRDLGFYDAEEAAPLVVWLASDLAAGITGRFFGIDGPSIAVWEMAKPALNFHQAGRWTVADIARQVRPALERLEEPKLSGVDALLRKGTTERNEGTP